MNNPNPLKDRGLTLIEVLVVVIAIGILAAVLLPAVCPGLGPVRVTACACNLGQLYKISHVYKARYERFPAARGSEYWLIFQKTDPPLREKEMIAIYFCPVNGEDPRPGATDYRGPANPISQYNAADPIGADLADNHPDEEGINVLRQAGDVQRIYRNDPLWDACDAKLCR